MADDKSFQEGAVKRILVVDDDQALANLLTTFFKKAGFEAQLATRGKQAVEIYKELRPHLVLLDVVLPDLMGFDALKQMREATWSTHSKFILMSGIMKDQKSVKEIRFVHKADEFIEKPFNVRQLHNTILKHLGMATLSDGKETKADGKTAQSPKPPVIPEPTVTIEGGDLASTDLPRILAAFFTAKVTGVLKVNYASTVKAIYVEEGNPIFAASNDPHDRIGEFIVRQGFATKEVIENALKQCNEQSRLGMVLVKMGVFQSSDLFNMIQLQVTEIILSTFAWSGGKYAFSFEDLAGREMIKLQTSPANLVLEGIRRYYTLERLDQVLVSRERVLKQTDNKEFRLQSLFLGSSDAKVFDSINGKRSIRKVISDSGAPELGILQLIYALVVMKLLMDQTD